jgi:hypothetical protein
MKLRVSVNVYVFVSGIVQWKKRKKERRESWRVGKNMEVNTEQNVETEEL